MRIGISCAAIGLGIGAFFLPRSVPADVRLHNLFGDNMVLQQGQRVPVWGAAAPGEAITVGLCGREVKATADDKGEWQAWLEPLEAGGPFEMAVSGRTRLTVTNVMVGEVWVCSGQSNMHGSLGEKRANAAAGRPDVRLFVSPPRPMNEPRRDALGTWQVCSPETAARFSAVGFFFGRDLHRELRVPVGLIQASLGGTSISYWTSRETIDSLPAYQAVRDWWASKRLISDPEEKREAMTRYSREIRAWLKLQSERKKGQVLPPQPVMPYYLGHSNQPANLFNGTVAPLIPYGIRGVIWYQGERDAGVADLYRKWFPALIRDWRKHWGQGGFPFLFVQLPNFGARPVDPGAESEWAELREAQLMTLRSVENTGMAVTIDIGDAKALHPPHKEPFGQRLARLALGNVYGRDMVYSGPIYRSHRIEGLRVLLSFDHVGGGLVTPDNDPLKGFAVAGADRKFVWAEAEIQGDQVAVWSDKVPDPVAVRYAWAGDPLCNLYNEEGLPASPFRTDDWPGATVNSRGWMDSM